MNITKLSSSMNKKPVSYRLLSFVVLMVALIVLMLKLSLWQWQRAEQKQVLLDQYQQQSQQIISLAEAVAQGGKAFQLVTPGELKVLGPRLWLDNQIQQGRVGYDLYSLAETAQGKVLIRQGWQPASYDRQQLLWPVEGDQQAEVYRLRYISLPILANSQQWLEVLPQGLRAQQLNLAGLAQQWGIHLLPFILDRQIDTSPQQLIAMPVQKHQAYALQWLLMAVVACGFSIYFLKRSYGKESR
ncbi:SURF1 family protein [Agarivorans sp. QJM3NY_33]|uniref:SURF1 family protein n=1 Tax=Agarivorans sp. QJM3NY_33 TaxID=3421432 RepID=UPI003D7CDFDC